MLLIHRLFDKKSWDLKCTSIIPTNLEDPLARAAWHSQWAGRYQYLDIVRNVPMGQNIPKLDLQIQFANPKILVDEYVQFYIEKESKATVYGKCEHS